MDIAALNEKIKQESAFIDLLFNEIGKVIVGQKAMVERLVVGSAWQTDIFCSKVFRACENSCHKNTCFSNES